MTIRNDEYWRKRMAILNDAMHDKTDAKAREIEKTYAKALDDIEKDLAAWYARYAENEGVSLADAKKILDKGALKAFKMNVEEYIEKGQSLDPAWYKELERASIRVHVTRLEALKIQMRQHVEELSSGMGSLFDDYLQSTYSDAYYRTAYELQKGWGVGSEFKRLDKSAVAKIISKPWTPDGSNFSDRIWSNRTKLVNDLHSTLTSSFARGLSIQKTSKEIAAKMNSSMYNATRLVRTESAAFHSKATQDCYEDLEVEYYKIDAVFDTRTSEICREMDGKVFKMSEYEVGVTAPPFHPNCRTDTIPYYPDSEADVGIKSARDEHGKSIEIPANTTYDQWYRKFVEGEDIDLAPPPKKVEKEPDEVEKRSYKDTRFGQAYGKKHYNAVRKIVESGMSDDQRTIWNECEPKFKVFKTDSRDAYFNQFRGVHLDLENDARGCDWSPPYQTTFHEFGHHIDHMLGEGFDSEYWFSSTYKDGLFGKTLRDELKGKIKAVKDDLKRRYNELETIDEKRKFLDDIYYGASPDIVNRHAHKVIQNELLKLHPKVRSSLSDLFGGITKNDIDGKFGHSKSYWKVKDNLHLEAFAEMWECVANPKQMEELKKWLPNSVKVFDEMMASLAKKIKEKQPYEQ